MIEPIGSEALASMRPALEWKKSRKISLYFPPWGPWRETQKNPIMRSWGGFQGTQDRLEAARRVVIWA